jgi:DNA-binding NarL/FixJ family response regulator
MNLLQICSLLKPAFLVLKHGCATSTKPKKNDMKNMRRDSAGQKESEESLDAAQPDFSNLLQQLAQEISNIVFVDADHSGITPTEAANLLKEAYPELNVSLFTPQGSKQITSPSDGILPPASLTTFFNFVYEAVLQTNRAALQKVATLLTRKAVVINDPYGLSPRELEVLGCLVNGDTYKKIAEHCHISVGTVRSHIMNIYRKLNVNSRSGAIVKAMHERLVH